MGFLGVEPTFNKTMPYLQEYCDILIPTARPSLTLAYDVELLDLIFRNPVYSTSLSWPSALEFLPESLNCGCQTVPAKYNVESESEVA